MAETFKKKGEKIHEFRKRISKPLARGVKAYPPIAFAQGLYLAGKLAYKGAKGVKTALQKSAREKVLKKHLVAKRAERPKERRKENPAYTKYMAEWKAKREAFYKKHGDTSTTRIKWLREGAPLNPPPQFLD